jgi:hypothetical protein
MQTACRTRRSRYQIEGKVIFTRSLVDTIGCLSEFGLWETLEPLNRRWGGSSSRQKRRRVAAVIPDRVVERSEFLKGAARLKPNRLNHNFSFRIVSPMERVATWWHGYSFGIAGIFNFQSWSPVLELFCSRMKEFARSFPLLRASSISGV